MKTIQKIATSIALGCALAAGSVTAAEDGAAVLVTGNKVGKGTEINLEFMGDGSAVAVQVELAFEGINPEQVNLSGCASPKAGAQLGTCHFRGNTLVFALINSGLAPLDSRGLAKVLIPAHKGDLKVTPVRMLVTDAKAVETEGELLVDMYGEVQAR